LKNSALNNVWVWVHHREGTVEEATLGLIAEARDLLRTHGDGGLITAVAMGCGLSPALENLGSYGVSRVLYIEDESLRHYQGEVFAKALMSLYQRHGSALILMAQTPEVADLAPRIAALLKTALVTHAVDLKINETGVFLAVRPVANGYLFEELEVVSELPPVVCFLPSVLTAEVPEQNLETVINHETLPSLGEELKTRVKGIVQESSSEAALDDTDVIIAGGRGMGGTAASFALLSDLASVLGGAVGGTRPAIDQHLLPFDRQIGQTGKTVAPRLMIVCGVSGANEFTAGMEKAQQVIAVNTDAHARIFRFANLGLVGDVHKILPLLLSKLHANKDGEISGSRSSKDEE
jgi:electron transfer flavoprotein alpha subunit